MARADVSDSAIKDALAEIKNNSSATNWILLGFAPKSDSKIAVVGKGDGGFSECIENFSDGKVLFALVAWSINNIKKFVYLSWCGEGVVGMKKGLFNNHANDVAALFKGFHVQVNARNEDDLNEKVISEKVKKAGGASYDSGAKVQGAAERVPTNVAQGRQQAAQSNVQAKSADKSDYNKKGESDQFWTQQKQDEERKKQEQLAAKNQPKTDYQKSQERDQFWAQQRQESATTTNTQRAQPQPTGSTASARSKFENQNQTQQAPPPSRPAPAKKATQPPPRQPEPEPEPEPTPEPEPEQQYEPEPQQESYSEPVQDDQGYAEEQPAQQDEWTDDTNNNQGYSETTQSTEYAEPEQQQYEEPAYQGEAEYTEQQYSDQQYSEESSSGGVLCQARALYEYQGENETDLSFAEGEIINVLDKSDPSGWWQGEISGRVGFFPSNFTEEI